MEKQGEMSGEMDEEIKEILRLNGGFSPIEDWIEFAKEQNFKKVPSTPVESCLNCNSKSSKKVSQFIYYSNLIELQKCSECGLVYTNKLLSKTQVENHFERAYKSEEYFRKQRAGVFQQVSDLILELSPTDGKVLDWGGATGELGRVLYERGFRGEYFVKDVSSSALDIAEKRGFKIIREGLSSATSSFQVVSGIDVLYYEKEFNQALKDACSIIEKGGVLILRLPNKLLLIELIARLRQSKTLTACFNPEHLYIFSRSFIERRLLEAGFSEVEVRPAKALSFSGAKGLLSLLLSGLSRLIFALTGGRIVCSPAMILIAKR